MSRIPLFAALAALALAAPAAQAQVLYSQPFIAGGPGSASQVFPDLPTFTFYSFDDFTVTGSGWDITKVTAFGQEEGTSALNTAVSLSFATSPDASAFGTTYSGVENASGSLIFTQPIHLAPGSYFITTYVTRPYSGGQWFFDETAPVSGSAFYQQNPGGGFGSGTAPYQPDPTKDLAFEIDGTLSAAPEPSSVAALAVGILGLGALALRKRSGNDSLHR